MCLKISSSFVLLFLFILNGNAQQSKIDSVANQLNIYGSNQSMSSLFVHFDKDIYINNDDVWFTGYLLKSVADIDQYDILYVSLVNSLDSTVVVQKKFNIEKGISFGNFKMPDSVFSGNYFFVVNTNVKWRGKPDASFIKSIVVKSSLENPLTARVLPFATSTKNDQKETLLVKVTTDRNRFVSGATVNYQIGESSKPVLTGTGKSNVIGEIKVDYPTAEINEKNNVMRFNIRKGGKIENLRYRIPVRGEREFAIRFYPEGGYLVNQLWSKVGWEIKDRHGQMIKAQAVLLEDEQIIDTISSNSSGLGIFALRPSNEKQYSVKLITEKGLSAAYVLPASLSAGVVINVQNAVGTDDVMAILESNTSRNVQVLLHNYEDIYLQTEIELAANSPRRVRMKTDDIQPGLYTITVLDEHLRPLAERIVFPHYDKLPQLKIQSDREIYTTRDSVALEITSETFNTEKLNGLFSVACVQESRLHVGISQNIVDYGYLQHELENLPVTTNGLRFEDLSYLNTILLVKGWRRYKWPQEYATKKAQKFESYEMEGQLLRGKRPPKITISLTSIGGSNINTFDTDSLGKFRLRAAELLTSNKDNIWLMASGKRLLDYTVNISEPLDTLKTLISKLTFPENAPKSLALNAKLDNISSHAGIKLADVEIKATREKIEPGVMPSSQLVNSCGDYVCSYNILNCRNHRDSPGNYAPTRGGVYNSRNGKVVYEGCLEREPAGNLIALKGIELAKEFYSSDIKNINEPINFPTVYWNYQYVFQSEQKNTLHFATGDLTGRHKIIIQGLSDRGPVYAEKWITVTRPNTAPMQ